MVDTVENRELVPRRRRDRAVVVEVGAPAQWLRAGALRPPSRPGDPLRVLFFGLFTPLHGVEVIAAAAAALADRPDIEITMIGDRPAARHGP